MSVYVVTGGATGIGFGIARQLCGRGDDVVLASRNRDKLDVALRELDGLPGTCTAAALDVRDQSAVTDLIESLDHVDGLVNNAAGNFAAPSTEISFNGFRAIVEISLYGTFLASQALARRLIAEGRPGSILNIVATYAWTGAPMVAASAAAKAGMVAFTKSVAREWGPYGIRVNALAPGFVPTEAAVSGILNEPEARQRMLDLIPLGRFGEAAEVADVAAFLLGERAGYVTGAVVTVDGGRSLGISMHHSQRRAATAQPA